MFEILVLDGYTFTQDTEKEVIGLTEAGEKPVRGQRSFNTALNPAEFSMTTYMRPFTDTARIIINVERVFLWEGINSS